MRTAALFACALLGLAACRTQDWYDASRTMAEDRCRHQPPAEYDRCMEKVNRQPYADYEKARQPEAARSAPVAGPAGNTGSVVLRKSDPEPVATFGRP